MQQQGPMAILGGILICFLVVLAVFLILYILFLLNLHRTLNAVSARNRELTPGLVWLSLVPIVSIVWNLIMVPKISNSLRKEYEDRGWPTDGEGFARVSGMIWAWGGVVSTVISVAQNVAQAADEGFAARMISLISCPVTLAIFVCWIMFWVQTYQYRKRLETEGRGYEPGSVEEDYDDELRRPRKEQEDDFDRPRRDEYPDEKDDRDRRRDDY